MANPRTKRLVRRSQPWLVGWFVFQAVVAVTGLVLSRRRDEGDESSTSIRRVLKIGRAHV